MEGGDANEPGDAGGSPGKSSLFFLTAYCPEIGSELKSDTSVQPFCFQNTTRLIMRQYWLGKGAFPHEGGHAFIGGSSTSLSFYVFMNDSHIFSHATADNQKMWTLGDVAEIFVKPGGSRDDYWEFHVTPNNFLMDMKIKVVPVMIKKVLTG